MTELTEHDLDEFAAWAALTRGDEIVQSHIEVLGRIGGLVPSETSPRIYDVGAGAGNFLALAQEAGYEASGNDLAPGAVRLVKERHGIDLQLGDLADLEREPTQDAVTMWCVMAHVVDGNGLLSNAATLLRPGGVLYLQTPRWSVMDRAAQFVADLTRGWLARILDRRIGLHHMVLHTRESLTAALENAGLEVVSIEPAARYSLATSAYLRSLRLPGVFVGPMSWVIDRFVAWGWVPRNVWDAYARRPIA
jgi:2-polyprenyl-3-methyl-5-hydroxy-6-metoxy-1,4-benzoquinol methylase